MTTNTNSLNSVQTINILWGLADDMFFRFVGDFRQYFIDGCNAKIASNAVFAQEIEAVNDEVERLLHESAAQLHQQYCDLMNDAQREFLTYNKYVLQAMGIGVGTVHTVMVARADAYVRACGSGNIYQTSECASKAF